jgi:hypothetical protein
MATPIQSPAKCEVRSVIRFLNAKGERPYIVPTAVQPGPRAQGFPLFIHLNKHPARKKFDDDNEVQVEAMTWFKGLAADFYDSGIQQLVPRLNNCLDNAGDYVEK